MVFALLAKAAVPPPSSSGSGDMGYSGSAGLQNQYYASNNTPCGYICYGFGQFDGQGSGHDFSGNVSSNSFGHDVFFNTEIHIISALIFTESAYQLKIWNSFLTNFSIFSGLAPRFRLGQQR
mmetsp:Transcript_22323/g.46873  ORF Transcript_22323/g.46873 Transcript_22323/m.46873 type:complete len:122 (-) Transcript_22323:310-675(-)